MMPRGLSRARLLALVAVLAAAVVTFVGTRYPIDLALHHTGTVAAVLLLAWVDRRWALSTASFAATLAFIVAHVIGAKYLYSFVPYDAWSEALFGTTISEVFGWERNHYDRLVHLLYGLLLSLPAYELSVRRVRVRPVVAALLVFIVVAASSALYEVLEWGLAVTVSPESAERYNGQQGDMWDAQKDIALAQLGCFLSLAACVLAVRESRTPDVGGDDDATGTLLRG